MMLAGGLDTLYRTALSGPHRHYVRVEVWSGLGVPLALLEEETGAPEGGLVFTAGAVTARLNSRVTRTLSLNVPSYMYPEEPTDLLAPFGNEIRAWRGITFADGSSPYVWQVFRGKIRHVDGYSTGNCVIYCSDRATDVVEHQFVTPQNSQAGDTVLSEWGRLILDALPDATFGTSDPFAQPVQPLTWEYDRGSALDEMARSVNGLWYALANGDFVMRNPPWIGDHPSLYTLTDAAGGTVNGWQRSRSRDQIFNSVTVTGELLTGDIPVYGLAQDTTPGSPTSIYSGFGVKSKLVRLQTPSSMGGADYAAESLLATAITPTEEWQLQVVPDAAMELGDIVTLDIDGTTPRKQAVSAFAIPLSLSGNMTVETRSLVTVGSA